MNITLEELEELKAEAKQKVSRAQVAIMAGLARLEVTRFPLAVLRLLDEIERLRTELAEWKISAEASQQLFDNMVDRCRRVHRGLSCEEAQAEVKTP